MQLRAQQTRRTILLSAATVFYKHGYAATSIDEIIAEAGVTKGALYFHFKSKAELAQAVVAAQYEVWDWEQAIVEAKKLPPLELIDGVLEIAGRLLGTDAMTKAGMRLVNDANNIPAELLLPLEPWINYMQPVLEQAQREGAVLAHIDCAAASRALVAGLFGVQELSDRLAARADMVKRVEEWWTQFMRPSLTGIWPAPDPKRRPKPITPKAAKSKPGAEAALAALARRDSEPAKATSRRAAKPT